MDNDPFSKSLYVSSNTGPKWGRVCRLIVGDGGKGKGIAITDLRVSFTVEKTIYHTPNTASFKIYNLNQETERLFKTKFDEVILIAGYTNQDRILFRGNFKYPPFFYRDGVERLAEIEAGDGDKDYHNALVNFTLTKDSSERLAFDRILKSFSRVEKGHIHGKYINRKRIRGKVYSGNARDVLTSIAKDNDAHWSFQDGKLVMVPVDSVLPGEAIAVSNETGLLGAPEANDKGITIKCMLDPRIIPNGKLWLKDNEVKIKRIADAQTGQQRKLHGPKTPARLDPQGVYKVFAVKHVGDNRGGPGSPWETESRCVGLVEKIPPKKGIPISSTPDGEVL